MDSPTICSAGRSVPVLVRFTHVGHLTLGDETEDAAILFAAFTCGSGLEALPPARMYAG